MNIKLEISPDYSIVNGMKSLFIRVRNLKLKVFYRLFLRPYFFKKDPEKVHDRMVSLGSKLGKSVIGRGITSILYSYSDSLLEQDVLGIHFKNPIGLAAGFDKDAHLPDILSKVGFGFAELGSVTAKPYSGNEGIRLWRLPKSKSLVVNYGLKNEGAKTISSRLRNRKFDIPIGVSIAKTNSPETAEREDGIKDYVEGVKYFLEIGDFLTINISCPNAFGGQPFHDAESLDLLFNEIDKLDLKKPIFVKISPDLSFDEVGSLIDIADRYKIDGFVVSNLTKKRNNEMIKDGNLPDKGGISGKVVERLSDKMISYVYERTRGKYVIMGCGGVFTPEDAYKKIKLGATLIQMITGMIFEGPQVISSINEGLVRLLKKDGYRNISEAVGANHKNIERII